MATIAELYQLSWVIEQLLADPQRIVQVRAQLHAGQQIQYLSWEDGRLADNGATEEQWAALDDDPSLFGQPVRTWSCATQR